MELTVGAYCEGARLAGEGVPAGIGIDNDLRTGIAFGLGDSYQLAASDGDDAIRITRQERA